MGSPGREAVKRLLPELKKELGMDFVIANAENIAGGSGITSQTVGELFDAEVDVVTAGDHIWKKKDIFELIQGERRIIRPLNFPAGAPGSGFGIFSLPSGLKIGIANVLGRVFVDALLECPFKTTMSAVEEMRRETKTIIVDMHAEATSEKVALGWYLDGKVSAVVGTHTHIQTADERILPAGTAYITDVGMTGPYDSVIGRRVEDVLERFVTSIPTRFEVAQGNIQLRAVAIQINDATGIAESITRIQRKCNA